MNKDIFIESIHNRLLVKNKKNIKKNDGMIVMTRKRGRPTKPIPVHPERVISRAFQTGLSSTVELQRTISNKTSRKHYESSRNSLNIARQVYMLTKNKGNPDHSYFLKAEPQIRDNTHKMLFENGAKYNFTEIQRQKKSDDTVGPINQRLNACGAALREFAHREFPFPDPKDFGIRIQQAGNTAKQFRVAGYDESSYGPRVTLAHPDLPSMDFGDAVRSHNEYLATFCAIHDVPVRETTRYSNLFLLLIRPYLEMIYSEYKVGKSGFQKGVNNALRQVKKLIVEAGFRPTKYKEERVTRNSEFESPPTSLNFFDEQIEDAKKFYGHLHPLVTELERIRNGGVTRTYAPEDPEDKCLTIKDVEYIRDKAVKRARIAGSILHRRIAALFPSPWHLNDVIFRGDRYVGNSDYVIVSEVPLQTKRVSGKVDLILFERVITEDGKLVLWEPKLVLEIKTRKAQRWWIEPDYKNSEVRSIQRVVSEFPMEDIPLNNDMWNSIINSTPRNSTQNQLNEYTQLLADSFQQSTKRKLATILTGTVIIDSSSEIEEVRSILELLVIHSYEEMKDRKQRIKRTAFTPKGYNRIALVIHNQAAPVREKAEVATIPWSPIYNPFKIRNEFKREFILYLSGKTSTSSGQSATWNARNYHGLQMLYDIEKSNDNTDLLWIDLADQFSNSHLAEARLRLKPRGYSEEELVKTHPEHIREFFENVEVIGCLDKILSFLYQEGITPQFDFENRTNHPRVIVVSGADTLREATPSSHRDKLKILVDQLLNSLPDDIYTTVVWFDSPVPSVEKALPYSSRALLPFYEDDSLAEIVTDIIWNLPVAPIGAVRPDMWKLPIIGDSSMHDDIRVIIRHSITKLTIELTHVPFLRGWSKRFRNKGRGLVIQERSLDDVVPEKETRTRMKLLALTMTPWLVRLWPNEHLTTDSRRTLESLIVQIENESRPNLRSFVLKKRILREETEPPNILDLLRLRLPDTRDAKSYASMTVGKINSQRLYRAQNKLNAKPAKDTPTLLLHEDFLIPAAETEPDLVFGIKFETEDDVTQPWWMVVQDITNEARMLVGCFTHRPVANDGFLWADTKIETLTQHSFDDILSLPQTIMIGKKSKMGMETWSLRQGDDEAIDSGVLEVISRGRSTVGHIRAVRQTFSELPKTKPTTEILLQESFYKRVVDSLKRYLEVVTKPTHVTVHLEMVDGECQVTFHDAEDVMLQTVTLDNTADLISLLRWPMIKDGSMFTDSGVFVIWSVFEDIQFGDLDFLRPYVSYKAARSTPEELPTRVAQFFDEAEEIQVGIEHDQSTCPIFLDGAADHGECWRIVLANDCPKPVRKQIGSAMTGEEINGILAPERLYAGKLYKFKITLPTVSEKDESIVFHEDKFIRIFLRNQGLVLKKLAPGTYLNVTRQQWMVEISWEDDTHLKWNAQSTVSELFFRGERHTIELTHGRGAEEECERILGIITSDILQEQIANYSKLEGNLLSDLTDKGYTKLSPPCELRVIESTNTDFSFGIYPVEGTRIAPYLRFTVIVTSEESPDALIKGLDMSFSEGELSHYSIRNKDAFMKKFSSWVSRNVPVIEELSEEPEEWEVTLFVNVKTHEIFWEAEQHSREAHQTDLLYGDKKILLDSSIEKAEQELGEIFEADVVQRLLHISNLDDVLKIQIPEMIRKLRFCKPSADLTSESDDQIHH